ncbi:hypothetical protein [Caballeronia sordidicola]|uniref:DUF2357 domain-containing protein n=1 Tax=Caballeronia sordidicola TaxID=196367 RepID=A0A242MW08_CABSO|nr:hypothetical protein [Caballeronia sordidicola]OTP75629.1 hypothetical protein PAMC26577_13150 [Caballeronia sordidicola]
MENSILLRVNGQSVLGSDDRSRPIVIREDDKLSVEITTAAGEQVPEVYFEDFQVELASRAVGDAFLLTTPISAYFSESFGFSTVRIRFPAETVTLVFDVMARKTSADQARKMILYLASHNDALIKACFARSSTTVGSSREEYCEPEMLLNCAESFVELLQSSRSELLNTMRQRLVPVKLPLWDAFKSAYEIDPYDVLTNLDALTPSSGGDDVFLRGRHFSLGGLDVSSVGSTADVQENKILLGGVYSLRRRITALFVELHELGDISAGNSSGGQYETFSRLMLSLTADGMIHRCIRLLDAATELIKLFEVRLAIKFEGELHPVMTPYARASRVYRVLFTKLSEWYELGTPALEGMKFLIKLRSLSKIYELYTLFHIFEFFMQEGWLLVSADPHRIFGNSVPEKVVFSRNGMRVALQYEPIVGLFSDDTVDMSLVDVHHGSGGLYSYWNPDFVLRFEIGSKVSYLILDAKYSTAGSVRDIHIPELFRKYYLGMSVYDAAAGVTTNAPIIGVFAIYSLDTRAASYISHWRRQGPSSRMPRIPMVGGVGLMIDNSQLFSDTLRAAIAVTSATMVAAP